MRRKKLWNKTLAAVLGLALVMGAPLVDLGNGRLLGGVEITAQAEHITQNTGNTLNPHWILKLSGTVTADEIRGAIGTTGTSNQTIRLSNIKEIICEPGTIIQGSLIGEEKDPKTNQNVNVGIFQDFEALETVDFTNATFSHSGDQASCSYMFKNCKNLKTIIWGGFDLSGFSQAREMFYGCKSLTSLDLSSFKTGSLREANGMFQNCTKLTTVNLCSWDTSNLNSTSNMFDGCTSLTTILATETWQTSNIAYSGNMFRDCTKLKGGNDTAYNSSNVGKSYARFDSTGAPGYLTYNGSLVKHDAVAETFTKDGNEEYWTSPNDGPEYQLVNGFFVEVTDHESEVVIPQILTTHHDEVSATPESDGTIEYWEGKDGKNYVWSDMANTYVEADDLTIPMTTVVESHEAVDPTPALEGNIAYVKDSNGNYFKQDENGEYTIQIAEGNWVLPVVTMSETVAAADPTPDAKGNKEYFIGSDGKKYLKDGEDYVLASDEDIEIAAVQIDQSVPSKAPSYGSSGAGNIAYAVGTDGYYYYKNDNDEWVKTDNIEDVQIPALELYMQADPVNTESAVDVLIYAEMPAGATPEDYSVVFGNTEVQFDSSYTRIINDKTFYIAKISAPAKNMATEYHYSIKNGQAVMFIGAETTSIRKYADIVLAGNSSEAVKKSCRAMLAYGASAQLLKGFEVNNLADAGIEGDGLDYSGVDLPDDYVFDKAGLNEVLVNAGAPVRYYAMSLNMDSETHVNLAFLVTSGTQDEAVAYMNENFTFGNKAVSAVKNSNTKYVVVRTDAIAIKNLLNDLSITYDETDYTINVQQYFTSALSSTEAVQNMCKALRNFYDCVTAKN